MSPPTEEFLSDCEKAAQEIREYVERGEFIPVFAHNDPDGVTAGAIIAKSIYRLGGNFLLRIIDRIDEEILNQILQIKSKIYVFTEIGSGYLDFIKKISDIKIIVMDHHKPIEISTPNLTHVNPMIQGFDGAKDVSGSAVCYNVAKKIDSENVNLSYLAVVGALGDLQDKNKERCLQGLNEAVIEDAKHIGLLQVSRDLLFFGRETRPIHQAIAITMNPFIPGLSGEEDNCLGFITSLGIPLKENGRFRTLSDLTQEEKEKIFSQLTIYLKSKDFSEATIFQLLGCIYTFLKEDKWTPLRDGREFASLLNACDKMGKISVAVSLCLGSRGEILNEAQTLLNEYRRTIGKSMDLLFSTPKHIVMQDAIYIVNGRGILSEKLVSPIASILSTSSGLNQDKPIIIFSDMEDGRLKVSARTNQNLVDRGLNLGEIMQTAADKFGGKGGGHNIAAGATIPADKVEEFIELVNRSVKNTLKK